MYRSCHNPLLDFQKYFIKLGCENWSHDVFQIQEFQVKTCDSFNRSNLKHVENDDAK